jgi:hypothetical protein
MAEEESQEKGIAYTITAGFYPELASALKWGTPKKGTAGATGRTYARKKGFSHSSINRMLVDEDPDLKKTFKTKQKWAPKVTLKNLAGALYGEPGFEKITAAMRGDLEAELLGGYKPGSGNRKPQLSMVPQLFRGDAGIRKRVSMSKWLGGSETYKLWGTKVWYQAGIRDKEMLLDAVKRWNATSDYLSQLYADAEPKMVKAATKLAEEVFGAALDEENLELDIKAITSDPDVAEETAEEYPKSWKMEVSDKMIDSRSAANKIDLQRTLEDGSKEYIDVTEMPITAAEQHGISEVPKALKDAISELKGESDETGLLTLKKEVIKMFINNIDRDNKIIDILVKKAEVPPPKGKRVKTFEKLLDAIEDKMKKEGKEGSAKGGQISRKDISEFGGIQEIEKGRKLNQHARESADKTAEIRSKATGQHHASQAAMAQVVHVLANLGDSKRNTYRQGFRVTEPVAGRSVYASVPMTMENMRFLKGPVKQGTVVAHGYSHILMLREKEQGLRPALALAHNRRISQSYARAKINGVNENGVVNMHRSASLGIQMKGSHHSTTVTFSPKSLLGMLDKAGKAASWNLNKINDKAKDEIMGTYFSWGLNEKDKFTNGRPNRKMAKGRGAPGTAARFWALPYIGVLDNQYHEHKKKKK